MRCVSARLREDRALMPRRGPAFLVVLVALLGVWLAQTAAQDLNFNQNAISVVFTVAGSKCPASSDASVAALRQQISSTYRVPLSEVVLGGCSALSIRCVINGTPFSRASKLILKALLASAL